MSDSSSLRTLVLSRSYQPLSIWPLYTTTAGDAISRYLTGSAEVVCWYDIPIKTPSRTDLYWPSVIVNPTNKNFMKSEVRLRRETILIRDNYSCFYCGVKLSVSSMTYDHSMPRSRGGKHHWENVISSCERCNREKSDQLPVGKWKPKKPIYQPTFHQMIDLRKNHPILIDDEQWVQFLPGFASENIILNNRIRKER